MPNFMVCRHVPNHHYPRSYWPPHVRHAARLWHGLPVGSLTAQIAQHQSGCNTKTNCSVEFISLQTCIKIGQLFRLFMYFIVVRTWVMDTCALSQAAGASVVLVIRIMCWAALAQFLCGVFFFSLSPEGVKLSGLGARLSTNSASSCQAGRGC